MVKKTVVKKKTHADEVTDVEFETYEQVTDTSARRRLVDYDKLIDNLDDRFLTVKKVAELMKACSDNKKTKVYYSEVLSAIQRLKKQAKLRVERRQDPKTNIIYYAFKKIES